MSGSYQTSTRHLLVGPATLITPIYSKHKSGLIIGVIVISRITSQLSLISKTS